MEHAALDLTFGRVVRHQLGLDQARVLVCGAAPVAPELLRWFRDIGLPVAEGYGSTEVTFSASANRPGANADRDRRAADARCFRADRSWRGDPRARRHDVRRLLAR